VTTAGNSTGTPDTTPPVVSITAPTAGMTVSGTIVITANATDDVAVTGVQFLVDGVPLGSERTVAPYHIPWNTTKYSTGSHTVTAVARDSSGNRTTSAPVAVTVVVTPPQPPPNTGARSPFGGLPIQVPGRFEAEDFDKGGEGVGYHDFTPGNQGGSYRLNEDVDIISAYPLGYVITDFQAGEWLEYTINVTQTGTYRVEALVSSAYSDSGFHIEVDGRDVTDVIAIPKGWWDQYRWVGKGGVNLTAGQHVLRVYVDADYFNLDALALSLDGASGRQRVVGH
jgi:hypothetical protein